MIPAILLDTGPLVASLDRRDAYHEWAMKQLDGVTHPLLTCEPVLTEACFLVRHLPCGCESVLELIDRKIIQVEFDLAAEQQPLRALLRKYADVPMSLADACLVRMSELHSDSRVFTIDGDFRRYRRNRRQKIPLIIPNGR